MADPAPAPPPGGSVAQTTAVALPMTSGLVVLDYLIQPVWPPPQSVTVVLVGLAAPVIHLVGKWFYLKLQVWTGINDPSDDEPVPAPAPAPLVRPAS